MTTGVGKALEGTILPQNQHPACRWGKLCSRAKEVAWDVAFFVCGVFFKIVEVAFFIRRPMAFVGGVSLLWNANPSILLIFLGVDLVTYALS